MKVFTVVQVIISLLVMSSMVLALSTVVQASSKGLKLYLTVDTNLNDDVRINTYQYGDRVFTHDALIHSGSNEITLQYPRGLIDGGEFRICVRAMDYDESACDTGYNSEAKQPEHVFINLFIEKTEIHLMAMLMLAKHRAKVRIMNRVRAKTMSRLQRSSTVLRIQGV